MKKYLTTVLLFALFMSLSAFPAMAESAPQQQGEYTRVEFVDVSEGTSFEASGTPFSELVTAPSSVAADEDYYDVLSEWGDIRGRALLIRQGRYDHLSINHGLTLATVQKVTQREDRVLEQAGGTTYKYETMARLYTCSTFPWPECVITAESLVRVVYDTYSALDGREFGVVTAYCPPTQGMCPSWVNSAL